MRLESYPGDDKLWHFIVRVGALQRNFEIAVVDDGFIGDVPKCNAVRQWYDGVVTLLKKDFAPFLVWQRSHLVELWRNGVCSADESAAANELCIRAERCPITGETVFFYVRQVEGGLGVIASVSKKDIIDYIEREKGYWDTKGVVELCLRRKTILE